MVEHEPALRGALQSALERAGHQVIGVGDGSSGLRAFHEHNPDLVLLDAGAHGQDAMAVLGRIRELADTPVLMLLSGDRSTDEVRGLNAGADDCVGKPFGCPELLARVNALLRRSACRPLPAPESFHDGLLDIDLVGRVVRVDGREISLTPLEYRVLVALVRHARQVLTPEQLLERAWADPLGVGPDRVKFVVMRLRRKLSGSLPSFSPIQAVRGFGYRYLTSTECSPDARADGDDATQLQPNAHCSANPVGPRSAEAHLR